MSTYDRKELVNTLIAQVSNKLQNIDTDLSVVIDCRYKNERGDRGCRGYRPKTSVELQIQNIELDIEGFEPNQAMFIIEIWAENVEVENSKLKQWNGEYSDCWDELSYAWTWYKKEEGEVTGFDVTIGYADGFIDLNNPPPLHIGKETLGVDTPRGGRFLGAEVEKGVKENLKDKGTFDKVVKTVLERIDYSKVESLDERDDRLEKEKNLRTKL